MELTVILFIALLAVFILMIGIFINDKYKENYFDDFFNDGDGGCCP